MLALGLWVVIVKRDYDSIHDALTSPSILAIVVGGIMVVTALIGLIGSASSNLWSLRVVSTFNEKLHRSFMKSSVSTEK